jgi:bifunctional non-homologous end joining protein LigD
MSAMVGCGSYTINGADWSKRYPLIVGAAARIQGPAILDAEVVWLDSDGMAQFDALHSRVNDEAAVACAFDLLIFDGDISDPGPLPSARQRYARHPGGHAEVFSTWSTPRATAGKCFKRFVSLVLKEFVSKKLIAPYRSGPSKVWIKIKNPNAPAATRATDGTFS